MCIIPGYKALTHKESFYSILFLRLKESFLIHRTKELNPYCGLGVCGEDHWKLVMKINGSKVIRDCNNQILRDYFSQTNQKSPKYYYIIVPC